jgi:DNA polymerase II small subunit/DNA polymerase delta subunit B
VTNPHEFSADGVTFLGTSGQNVDDVWKCALLPHLHAVLGVVICQQATPTEPCDRHAMHMQSSTWFAFESSSLDCSVGCLCRYSDVEERLDIMEALLRWRHLAPTAPDTLPAIPLSEADPFILTASPAVFFVGCQPSYGTRLVTGALLTVFTDLTLSAC